MSILSAEYETERKIREEQWQERERAYREERYLREQQWQLALEKLLKSFQSQTVHDKVTPPKCPIPNEKPKIPNNPEYKTGSQRKKSKSKSKTANCKFQNHKCTVHEKKKNSYVLSFCYGIKANVFCWSKSPYTSLCVKFLGKSHQLAGQKAHHKQQNKHFQNHIKTVHIKHASPLHVFP